MSSSSGISRMVAGLPLPLVILLPCVAMAGESQALLLDALALPVPIRQLILVTAPDAGSADGELQCWERPAGAVSWRAAASPHPVALGRAGLAWGIGLHVIPEGAACKREGDGKSPAGIFRLGTAFGYDPLPVPGSRWPYRQATAQDYFVDDPESPDYNRWVTLAEGRPPECRWRSFERLRRPDGLYRHGVIVEHNPSPVRKGAGSAIFLHLWKGPGEATSGCTAMAEPHLLVLLRWLCAGAHPVFVQVTEADLAFLRLQAGLERTLPQP